MERGLRKVRKARTVVMVMLVAVALAIILIDRNQVSPLETQQEVVSHETTEAIMDSDTGVTTPPPHPDNSISNSTVLSSSNDIVMNMPGVNTEESVLSTNSPESSSMLSIHDQSAHELALPGHNSQKKSLPKVDSNGSRYHTVAGGETLGSIAQKYYQKASYWQKIKAANPQINPNRLKLGTKIVIPTVKQSSQIIAKVEKTTRRAGKISPKITSSKKSKHSYGVKPNSYHEVQRGETLTKIAKLSGVPFLVIYDHNKKVLKNPHVLRPGTRIWIPPLASKR